MKKLYIQPSIFTFSLTNEPLLALSGDDKGLNVTFDNPDTDVDASTATARQSNLWDEEDNY